MTCVRAEDAVSPAAADDVAAALVSRGGLIQKVAAGGGRRPAGSARSLQRSAHLATGDGNAPAPAVEASCSWSGRDFNGKRSKVGVLSLVLCRGAEGTVGLSYTACSPALRTSCGGPG